MKLQKIIFLALATGLFILILLSALGHWRMPFIQIKPLEAVPYTSPMVWSINDWTTLQDSLEKTTYSTAFSEDYFVHKIQKDLKHIQKVFRGKEGRISWLEEKQILVAMQSSAAHKFDFLYVLDATSQKLSEEEVFRNIAGRANWSASQFRGRKIYTLSAKRSSSDQQLAFSCYRNLLLIAPYALLIEDAINQIKQPQKNLLKDKEFSRVKKALDPGVLHAYVGLHNLPAALSTFFDTEDKAMLRKLEGAFSWLGFSAIPSANHLHLKGHLAVPEGAHILQKMTDQEKGTLDDLAKILPDNTAIATWINFSDWAAYYREEEDPDGEFQYYFHPWLGKDFAYVITEPYSKGLAAEKFAVFRVANADSANYYLEEFVAQKGELKNFDYQSYTIRQVMAGNMLRAIFGEKLNAIQNPYYTQVGDYLVCSNSRQSLEIWIDKYIVGQTLARDASYLQWQEERGPANASFYIEPSNASSLLLSFLKENLRERVRKGLRPYLQFKQIAFQLSADGQGKGLAIEAHLNYGEKKEKQTSIVWKTNLSDTIIRKPELCYNPVRKAYEVFVQDRQNNIYLLNQGGDILWKRPMEGPILSSLFLIDYYQNGQQQFLFNTAGKIHLIDDAGNDIGTFPLKLQSPANNGMMVVDFQKRGEYAFFLACENGNAYGFSQTGSPLPGWNPRPGVGKVKQVIRHFVCDNSDYFVILNKRGKLFAYKRDGTNRFKAKELNVVIASPLGIDVSERKARIVGADSRGRLSILNETGGLFHLNMAVGKNEEVLFAYDQVLGDPRKDYIGLSDKELAVYTYTKDGDFESAWTYSYEVAPDTLFTVGIPSLNYKLIGSLNRDLNQINLLDAKGKLFPGFPLVGSTAFQIAPLFGTDNRVLVVANGESVYAYRLGKEGI